MLLLVSPPDGQTESVSLGRGSGVVIGRSAKKCDIVVADKRVSNMHCRFAIVDGRAAVEDLGSRNGTYVNGRLTKESPLESGDVVKIGHSTVSISCPASPLALVRAMAVGVVSKHGIDASDLREAVETLSERSGSAPNKHQRHMARQWGLEPPGGCSFSGMARLLGEFLRCRAWVYSVCRHRAATHWWRTYGQSGLPEAAVNAAARRLMETPGLVTDRWKAVGHKDWAVTQEDLWFKVSDDDMGSWDYTFVATTAQRHVQEAVTRSRRRKAQRPASE